LITVTEIKRSSVPALPPWWKGGNAGVRAVERACAARPYEKVARVNSVTVLNPAV
jgi:hypothetical protein